RNLAAFEWGRAWVVDPALVRDATGERQAAPALGERERVLVDAVAPASGELRRLLEIRIPDLVGWGGEAVATRYADELARVRALESDRIPGSSAVTEAVARGLHKLTAYKDEYEVARLHIEGLAALPKGARIHILLH